MAKRADIKQFSAALADRGALKLWSVIVTVLGDMFEGGVSEVPGPVLSALIEEMGLQPQAMRVALHRLRKDGWVDSRRAARIGYYALSQHGISETRKVAARVYGSAETEMPVLAVLANGTENPADSVSLGRQVLLADATCVPKDALVSSLPRDLPSWVHERLTQAACEADFADLLDLFGSLGPLPSGPFGQLTLRLLVLHGWRRLVLRSNPLAEAALGPGCAAMQCRAKVAELLAQLPRSDPSTVREAVR